MKYKINLEHLLKVLPPSVLIEIIMHIYKEYDIVKAQLDEVARELFSTLKKEGYFSKPTFTTDYTDK